MSGAAIQGLSPQTVKTTSTRRSGGRAALAHFARWFRFTGRVLLSPFRAFMTLRRSMTWASVTLLLIGIISLNVIWGYPWTGMFAACMSLLFAGFAINRIMHPSLGFNFSLPCSAPAGESFSVTTYVTNHSRLPAIELVLGFFQTPRRRRKLAPRSTPRDGDTAARVPMIMPGQRFDMTTSLIYEHRGVHRLPDVVVTNMFPFHLFRSVHRRESDVEIAITPRPMTGNEDAVARTVLNALGGWSHKLLSGDALDYTGSREYVVGMPVRRWDFSSWARLGRPIVREFQSPSIQTVMLVVDTAVNEDGQAKRRDLQHEDPRCERVLSLAATAITELSRKMVRIQMYVASEPLGPIDATIGQSAALDCEPLLIRLAAARGVPESEAQTRIDGMIERAGGAIPVLVLTSRGHDLTNEKLPTNNVTFLRVDSPSDSDGAKEVAQEARTTRKTVA